MLCHSFKISWETFVLSKSVENSKGLIVPQIFVGYSLGAINYADMDSYVN